MCNWKIVWIFLKNESKKTNVEKCENKIPYFVNRCRFRTDLNKVRRFRTDLNKVRHFVIFRKLFSKRGDQKRDLDFSKIRDFQKNVWNSIAHYCGPDFIVRNDGVGGGGDIQDTAVWKYVEYRQF